MPWVALTQSLGAIFGAERRLPSSLPGLWTPELLGQSLWQKPILANTLYPAARLLLVLLLADPELVRVVGNGRLCSVVASGKGCGVRHCPGREPQVSGAKDVTPHTHREPHACLRATATLAVPLRVPELSNQATLPSSFRLAFPMGAPAGDWQAVGG